MLLGKSSLRLRRIKKIPCGFFAGPFHGKSYHQNQLSAMDQVSFPGWQPEKLTSVVTGEQTTRVFVKGQPYMSWQSKDEGRLRLAIVQLGGGNK